MVNAEQALDALLAGEVEQMDAIESVPHRELEAIASSTTLWLHAGAVLRVLEGLASGAIPIEQAHRWGEFIFWGHGPRCEGPINSLDIEYDPEDPIVEAIMRLQELGDIIDGEIDDAENAQLQAALRAGQRESGFS